MTASAFHAACGVRVVEVKCPITLRDGNMSSLDWMVVESDGKFRLRITHRHYYQVQMQLFVTNREYCDIVVWSPGMLYIERIVPDSEWWAEKSKQGMLFHAKCVMPELCMKYFTTKSVLMPSNGVVQSGSTSKYCICGGEDDGQKMICCDNEHLCTVVPCQMFKGKTCAEGQVVLSTVQKRDCKAEIRRLVKCFKGPISEVYFVIQTRGTCVCYD